MGYTGPGAAGGGLTLAQIKEQLTLNDLSDVNTAGAADGQVLKRAAGSWAGAAAAAGGGSGANAMDSGVWYVVGGTGQQAGASMGQNNQYVGLMYLGACTITQLGVNVQAAGTAGQTFRMGLWNIGANGKPTTVLLDAGTVAADSTGFKTITLGTPLVLAAGWYGVGGALQGTGSGATMAVSTGGGASDFSEISVSTSGAPSATQANSYRSFAATSGALQTFDTGTNITTWNQVPRIHLLTQ